VGRSSVRSEWASGASRESRERNRGMVWTWGGMQGYSMAIKNHSHLR